MKLWLISQRDNNGYDTYDSAVVAAETEEEARCIHPDNWGSGDARIVWNGLQWMWHLSDGRVLNYGCNSWTIPDRVSVEFLADGYTGSAGCVLASFNAG